ncbi:DUF1648 domain-containing protein [Collinsella tanakaei]|uniref:DUF1648 domain-containing protein n=1 Tax=Collinsella tanakaei TaxID=626935 RepID=UPI001F45574B|nr:DUF1648 domain-containing protein [Collinsella tanakaei]MCF2622451.1 DUF1648 domain-containing protein [Collinsella tanakaei]MDM8301764.1 DUF1648 domain-containing protein [Collinsella tanakaei]
MSSLSMFKYGKKAGYLGIATIVLALIPVVIALVLVPGLPDEVPMRFDATGAVTRYGSKFEMLIPAAMSVAFGFGIYVQTARKAAEHAKDSMTMAVGLAERFLRSGVITTAVINVANAYLLYMVLTGTNPLVF